MKRIKIYYPILSEDVRRGELDSLKYDEYLINYYELNQYLKGI